MRYVHLISDASAADLAGCDTHDVCGVGDTVHTLAIAPRGDDARNRCSMTAGQLSAREKILRVVLPLIDVGMRELDSVIQHRHGNSSTAGTPRGAVGVPPTRVDQVEPVGVPVLGSLPRPRTAGVRRFEGFAEARAKPVSRRLDATRRGWRCRGWRCRGWRCRGWRCRRWRRRLSDYRFAAATTARGYATYQESSHQEHSKRAKRRVSLSHGTMLPTSSVHAIPSAVARDECESSRRHQRKPGSLAGIPQMAPPNRRQW